MLVLPSILRDAIRYFLPTKNCYAVHLIDIVHVICINSFFSAWRRIVIPPLLLLSFLRDREDQEKLPALSLSLEERHRCSQMPFIFNESSYDNGEPRLGEKLGKSWGKVRENVGNPNFSLSFPYFFPTFSPTFPQVSPFFSLSSVHSSADSSSLSLCCCWAQEVSS